MIGGLMKTTSRFAIAAAAGLFAGGIALSPANAADLGGDCCADLEERVAELEATTVRKGNRKVSLNLSGHVNKMIMFWDDGINQDVYVVDNDESETRFRLTGDASIAPGWSAGFIVEIEVESASSDTVDQRSDGRFVENGDGIVNNRRASFHVRNDQLGKLTIGYDSPATDSIISLNLADNPIADSDYEWGNGFFLARPQGSLGCTGAACRTGLIMNDIAPNLDTRRGDVVRYDSPSLFGLVISASWGEDDLADVAVRFKKEWNSIRMVAGVGYLWDTDETETFVGRNNAGLTNITVCPNATVNTTIIANCVDERQDLEEFKGSASLMHVPTGVFAHAAFVHQQYGVSNTQSALRASAFPSTVTGQQAQDGTMWYLQAGVKRRLLMPNAGATTLYVEYQQYQDFGVGRDADSLLGLNPVPGCGAAVAVVTDTACSEVTDSGMSMWGIGIVQDIDPAAMKVYAALRLFDPTVRAATVANAPPLPNNGPAGADVSLEEFMTIAVGGKIEF